MFGRASLESFGFADSPQLEEQRSVVPVMHDVPLTHCEPSLMQWKEVSPTCIRVHCDIDYPVLNISYHDLVSLELHPHAVRVKSALGYVLASKCEPRCPRP